MAVNRSQANAQMLEQTMDVQNKTEESIFRMQRQAIETEQIAAVTLEELRKQGQQMDEIAADLDSVSDKLDNSQALQNRFDRWAGNWFGGKKRAALREAASEIAAQNQEDYAKIREVFEQEKYDTFTRVWKSQGLVLVTNPSLAAPQLFDPATQAQTAESSWVIDYAVSGVDAEGWTYGTDFPTLNSRPGEATPKWNHYARRRKWRFHERKSDSATGLEAVRDRQVARANTRAPGASATQAEKIGYQPRQRAAPTPTASGLSSNMGRRAADQELDAESAAGLQRVNEKDAALDAGLAVVGDSLDRLNRMAGDMNQEVKLQSKKLDSVEHKMQVASEKQTVVNARQKKLVESS